ncbi:MAG: class I SAM-dependent methyltransferase [Anaerolineae bacterium]|nr:class I SAM-dependent methyltransferase [Anaerolineae bacterium]
MSDSLAFDRAAEYYDATRGFPPGVEAGAVATIARAGRLDESCRVLEVGVGTGRIALPLSHYTGAYVGLDLARPMMARLRAKSRGEVIRLLEGDATRLPFPAGTFDAVISVHVFHLIPTWPEVLREIARVLRPGCPLINAYNRYDDTFAPAWEAFNAFVARETVEHPGVRRDQFDRFLPDSGWRLVADETYAYAQDVAPQRLIDQVRGRMWSTMWRVPEDVLVRAVAALEAAMTAHFGDPAQAVAQQCAFRAQAFLPPGE